MSNILNLIGITIFGVWLLASRSKNKNKNKQTLNEETLDDEEIRKNTVCKFDDEKLSQQDFENIVVRNCRRIKRVYNVNVEGSVVSAKFQSQSGITSWSFVIDFNDYGKITGRYWISTTNKNSEIPRAIANMVKESIEQL